jgi:hypothetical protein
MSDIHKLSVSPADLRAMMTLKACAAEAAVSRRFLEKEIARGRLRAIKMSTRICRVRRSDWEHYIDSSATKPTADQETP